MFRNRFTSTAMTMVLAAALLGGGGAAHATPELINVTSEESVWVEIDSATAQAFEAGDWEVIDKYFDAVAGVNSSEVLDDFPTDFNKQQFASESNLSSQSLQRAAAAVVKVEKNPHGCKLLPYGTQGVSGGVMAMHKRTGSGTAGKPYGSIGWKPVTQCLTAPTKIANANLFYRTTVGGLWYPEAAGKTGQAFGVSKYTQTTIEWVCQNTKREDWRGRTISTVTARNGKVYVAQQHTNAPNLPCGIK